MKKYVIYTGIFGEYDDLPKIHSDMIKDNQEFICFSDRNINNSYPWKVIVINQHSEDSSTLNRRVKFLAHYYFCEYEYALYIDGNIALNKNAYEVIENHFTGTCMFFEHPFLKNLFLEITACLSSNRISLKEALTLYKKYDKSSFNLYDPKHMTNRFFIRSIHDSKTNKCFEDLFNSYINGPKRDQLHMDYLLHQHKVSFDLVHKEVSQKVFSVIPHKKKLSAYKKIIDKISGKIKIITFNIIIYTHEKQVAP